MGAKRNGTTAGMWLMTFGHKGWVILKERINKSHPCSCSVPLSTHFSGSLLLLGPTVTGCPVSNPGNNCANGLFSGIPVVYYPGQKKNHRGDASSDIEESAVWFRRDAVASRVRSRFCSWIKHLVSLISQNSDFMHQQHGSFFWPG